ncbi:MAG: hypothetical protein E6Q76_05945 [Rhizobium sp.]|nr:MAG: hypothetical protein E6Q76_05945 [Rhizobium sp.]
MGPLASLLMCVAGVMWLGKRSCSLQSDDCCTRLLSCILLNAAALCLWMSLVDTAQAFLLWLEHGLAVGLLVLAANVISSVRTHSPRPLQPVAGYVMVMLLIGLCGPAAGAL